MSEETLNTVEVDTNIQDNPRDSEERQNNKKGKTFYRKKVCRFCSQKAKIDYKDPDSLPNGERYCLAVLPVPVQSINAN